MPQLLFFFSINFLTENGHRQRYIGLALVPLVKTERFGLYVKNTVIYVISVAHEPRSDVQEQFPG